MFEWEKNLTPNSLCYQTDFKWCFKYNATYFIKKWFQKSILKYPKGNNESLW